MNLVVMFQYYGNVIHGGGSITYRSVQIELTEAQAAQLALRTDEDYAAIAINDPVMKHRND